MLLVSVSVTDGLALGYATLPPKPPNAGMHTVPPFVDSLVASVAYFENDFCPVQSGGTASGWSTRDCNVCCAGTNGPPAPAWPAQAPSNGADDASAAKMAMRRTSGIRSGPQSEIHVEYGKVLHLRGSPYARGPLVPRGQCSVMATDDDVLAPSVLRATTVIVYVPFTNGGMTAGKR